MSKRKPIIWRTERRRVGDLIEWDRNPRLLTDREAEELDRSLETFGYVDVVVVNTDGSLIGGHMRKRRMLELGMISAEDDIDVRVPSRKLNRKEAEQLAIRLNKNTGSWDLDRLKTEFDIDDLLDWGFEKWELNVHNELLPDVDVDTGDDEGDDQSTRHEKGELVKVEFLMPRRDRDQFFATLAELKKLHDLHKTEDAVNALVEFYRKHK